MFGKTNKNNISAYLKSAYASSRTMIHLRDSSKVTLNQNAIEVINLKGTQPTKCLFGDDVSSWIVRRSDEEKVHSLNLDGPYDLVQINLKCSKDNGSEIFCGKDGGRKSRYPLKRGTSRISAL